MKKSALIISLLLITGCAGKVPQDNELKGNWINESITLRTELKFLNNNICEFSSGSKIQNTWIKIPCRYLVSDENIEIYQTDKNSNIVNKIFVLEYESVSDSLLLKKSDRDYKPIIFKKK